MVLTLELTGRGVDVTERSEPARVFPLRCIGLLSDVVLVVRLVLTIVINLHVVASSE